MKNIEKASPTNDGTQAETDAYLLIESLLRDMPIPGSGQFLEEHKAFYPEVYNPDQAEIRSLSEKVVGRISDEDMLDFVKMTCGADMDDAEGFLASKIANAYGLKDVPDIIHLDADDADPEGPDKMGGFDRDGNTIILYFGEGSIKSFYDHVEVLSHELWHAKQYEMMHDGEERGILYKENLDHYIRGQMDEEGYRRQIIEAEAFDIGGSIAARYIYAQYSYLDDNDFAELRALKAKHGIHNISDLDRVFEEIGKDNYFLLYLDFKISSPAESQE